ncbi:MAG: hypothetical protein L0H93_15410 [Nocardioides sp.]|nr:hypothetical protein [Nocardioides sp.]
MGQYLSLGGYIEFRDQTAMEAALAAVRAHDGPLRYAWQPIASMLDAVREVFGGDESVPAGEYGFSVSGSTQDSGGVHTFLTIVAPFATANTHLEVMVEQDEFCREKIEGGVLVTQRGERTYVDPDTGRTEDYVEGRSDALAAVEQVLTSRVGAGEAGPLMRTLRAYLSDRDSDTARRGGLRWAPAS